VSVAKSMDDVPCRPVCRTVPSDGRRGNSCLYVCHLLQAKSTIAYQSLS